MYPLVILMLAILPSSFAEDICVSTCRSLETSDSRLGTCYDRNYDTAKSCWVERPRISVGWLRNLYYYASDGGYYCNGRCGNYGSSYKWCYKDDFGYDYCNLDKIYETPFYTGLKQRIDQFKLYYSSEPICFNRFKKVNSLIENAVDNKVTLESASSERKVLDHSYPLSLMIAYIKYEKWMINYFEFADEHNPLKGVSTAIIPGYDDYPEIQLTMALEAVIHKRHVSDGNCDDVPKNRTKLLRMEEDDDIGFLLAPKLGGRGDWYNVVPMYNMFGFKFNGVPNNQSNFSPEDCNYGISNLYLLDQALRQYLVEKHDRYVEWNMVVNYENLPSSPRPTEFIVDATLRDSEDYLVERDDPVFQGKPNVKMIIRNGPK